MKQRARENRPSKLVDATSKGKLQSKVLEHVGAEDGRSALRALAERHPELIAEIEKIVHDLTASTTAQAVADRVVAALAELSPNVREANVRLPFDGLLDRGAGDGMQIKNGRPPGSSGRVRARHHSRYG